jgi:hypothetical protein
VLEAANRLRQLVSIVNDPPFDIIIRQGGLFRFVTMLSHPNLKLAFEAAWCLTNIASGNANHTRAVVESGAIPPLVELLASEDGLLRDQVCSFPTPPLPPSSFSLVELHLEFLPQPSTLSHSSIFSPLSLSRLSGQLVTLLVNRLLTVI